MRAGDRKHIDGVNWSFAGCTRKSGGCTIAGKAVYAIGTGAIDAWVGGTFVNIIVTVDAIVTRRARACVAIHPIGAGAIDAWVGGAFVNIGTGRAVPFVTSITSTETSGICTFLTA